MPANRTFLLSALAAFAVQAAEDTTPALNFWRPSGKKDHDPWKKFCGSTPCYDVLEVPFDADESTIRKSYRKLAREWHPDKNPEKGARAKFQKIAKAYEVLSTDGERAKYERMMKYPEEYTKEYGMYFFKVVAPPTSATLVVLLLLAVFSGIHYMALGQKKTEYNARLTKACVENQGPSQGGTVETQDIHREAVKRFSKGGKKSPKLKDLKIDAGFSAAVVEVLKEENMLLPDPTVMDTFGVKIFTSGPGFVLSLLSGSKEKGE